MLRALRMLPQRVLPKYWLPLTKRPGRDQSNGGVLNGIMQPIDSFAAIPKWQPPATAANGGQIIPRQ